mmetsp:Transcript_18051/g.25781  ORF Transcript_18051/g.25781 Transcript_18051/m.25781 type:complete len:80 (+) Transcript_18051:216-455(+)
MTQLPSLLTSKCGCHILSHNQYLNLAAVIPLRVLISSAKNSTRHSNRRSSLRSSTDARMQHRMQHISLLVDCSRMSIFT